MKIVIVAMICLVVGACSNAPDKALCSDYRWMTFSEYRWPFGWSDTVTEKVCVISERTA